MLPTNRELYLVSWHKPRNYKIFYSNDYGITFELKYTSPVCDFINFGYRFTAGREPGSFYVMRNTGTSYPENQHAQIYLDYSHDYGKTFTTYFHDLDSNYPFTSDIKTTDYKNDIVVHPNPCSDKIYFNTANFDKTIIQIFNTQGLLIKTIETKKQNSLDVSQWQLGVYIYKVIQDNTVVSQNKFIKL